MDHVEMVNCDLQWEHLKQGWWYVVPLATACFSIANTLLPHAPQETPAEKGKGRREDARIHKMPKNKASGIGTRRMDAMLLDKLIQHARKERAQREDHRSGKDYRPHFPVERICLPAQRDSGGAPQHFTTRIKYAARTGKNCLTRGGGDSGEPQTQASNKNIGTKGAGRDA